MEVMKTRVTSFKWSHTRKATVSAPDPAAGHHRPTASPETPGHSQLILGHPLVGSLLLSPGSWYAQGFFCALQKSVPPVLCNFYNQIPLASKVKFPGGSQPSARSFIGKSVVGPRTFLTVRKFIWYNCFAVCGSSAQRLYGGFSGDLLHEDLCHMLYDPGLLTQSPCPCSSPLLTCTSARDTQTLKGKSGSISVGPMGPGSHKVLSESSEHLWQVWSLILNAILPLLPS